MNVIAVDNFVLESDFRADPSFFDSYLDQTSWVDSNILYGRRISEVTGNKPMIKHYIKHIERYDYKLKKFVARIFKSFGISSRDFRCDFFLVKPGGHMPPHIDSQSKIAILLPLSPNTGPLICEDASVRKEYLYQTLTILNTQIKHEVLSPTEDRLLFRIGVHDCDYSKVYQFATGVNFENH